MLAESKQQKFPTSGLHQRPLLASWPFFSNSNLRIERQESAAKWKGRERTERKSMCCWAKLICHLMQFEKPINSWGPITDGSLTKEGDEMRKQAKTTIISENISKWERDPFTSSVFLEHLGIYAKKNWSAVWQLHWDMVRSYTHRSSTGNGSRFELRQEPQICWHHTSSSSLWETRNFHSNSKFGNDFVQKLTNYRRTWRMEKQNLLVCAEGSLDDTS